MAYARFKYEVDVEADIAQVLDQDGVELDIKDVSVDRYGQITIKVHVDYPEEEND